MVFIPHKYNSGNKLRIMRLARRVAREGENKNAHTFLVGILRPRHR